MKRSPTLVLAFTGAFAFAAAGGVTRAPAALTPLPADLVAQAGGQDLSAERLANIMANAQFPIQADIASVVAKLWVSYQLLGAAGARGDSLDSDSVADIAMWATADSIKAAKYYDVVRKSFSMIDTTGLDQRYASGDYLAAQHILFLMPEGGKGLSQEKQDSIRRFAESVRAKVTNANFGEMADRYTDETGGRAHEGALGVFGPGEMQATFESAVRALKPGEIAPGLVQTVFGYHIIRRNLLSEVRADYVFKLASVQEQAGAQRFLTKLQSDYKLAVRPGVAAKAREVALDPDAALNDGTVLATSTHGNFTARSFARWVVASYSPSAQKQFVQQITAAPDSVALMMVGAFAAKELFVNDADNAKVTIGDAKLDELRGDFHQMFRNTSQSLRVDYKSLSESAKTPADRARLAAWRIEAALDVLFMSNGKGFVDIPAPLAAALRDSAPWRVNKAGFEAAVARAQAIRAALDSTRARTPAAPTSLRPPPA